MLKDAFDGAFFSDRLIYNPDDGVFCWRYLPPRSKNTIGSRAGSMSNGYVMITICKQKFGAHRIAWVVTHGMIPKGMQIDHINGDRSDNRVSNLRLASVKENGRNRRQTRIVMKGATFVPRVRRWQSSIKVNGKSYHLGMFASEQEAHYAYADAANKYFGEFARAA